MSCSVHSSPLLLLPLGLKEAVGVISIFVGCVQSEPGSSFVLAVPLECAGCVSARLWISLRGVRECGVAGYGWPAGGVKVPCLAYFSFLSLYSLLAFLLLRSALYSNSSASAARSIELDWRRLGLGLWLRSESVRLDWCL